MEALFSYLLAGNIVHMAFQMFQTSVGPAYVIDIAIQEVMAQACHYASDGRLFMMFPGNIAFDH